MPNWQHHSKRKSGCRTLRPQALRQSRERLKALLRRLDNAAERTMEPLTDEIYQALLDEQ